MRPTNEQYREGETSWGFRKNGLSYRLKHHFIGEASRSWAPQGVWCYYLLVESRMLPESWEMFKFHEEGVGKMGEGPGWDAVDFHNHITWATRKLVKYRYLKRGATFREAAFCEAVEVGCDYGHFYDASEGFIHGFDEVKADALRSVDQFFQAAPDYINPYPGVADP